MFFKLKPIRQTGGVEMNLIGMQSGRTAPIKRTTGHEAWADVARGAATILVVLLHVREWHYLFLGWQFPGRPAWDAFIAVSGTIRMPLFFAISGMLAHGAVMRPWQQGGKRRLVNGAFLYVVWLSIYALFYAPLPDMPEAVHGVGDALLQLVAPHTALWYLWALAMYFALTKALRNMNRWPVLAAAAALCVVGSSIVLPDSFGMWQSILKNLVYFMAGAYGPWLLRSISDATSWKTLTVAGAAFLATTAGLLAAPDFVHWFGADLVAGLIAIVFAVQLATVATRWQVLRRPFAAVGQRALSIFLMQALFIALLNALALGVMGDSYGAAVNGTALGAAYPGIATVTVVAACLGAHRLLLFVRAKWLLEAPAKLAS
ncbi:hypothetical protein TV39_16140 [Arthrobacter sp. SPG23]|uniref:acyltransferase family protein n=1 Tax=Arthrobacter sp. SPG23 TaxID=1610703 RepID=UPI0005B833B1|nr:acyltransferase [Arthrobacter sp. SPG23]KIS26186.1 hypothetical protein TV39_16140 [Arthrobacter sp. SPG23]